MKLSFLLLIAVFPFPVSAQLGFSLIPASQAPRLVTLDSPSPLLQIKVMVKAGSAQDPAGLEGLAQLTGSLLIQGSFGEDKSPVTKERLAELSRPWGGGAYPTVSVSKEATVFSFVVPRPALDEYVEKVIGPMFNRPLFDPKELDRVRAETLQGLRSALRFERIEMLGLLTLDNVVHEGTSYAHPQMAEKGLEAVDREALLRFYAAHYRPENLIVGVSSTDKAVGERLSAAFKPAPQGVQPFSWRPAPPPLPARGRSVLIVAMPNAISTGLHGAAPLSVSRKDKDFWPLYVGNLWLGAHRDDFARLYQLIREERGYNYGDYSYIEHFEGRPEYLFQPPNTPRRHQYFSLWLRPVAHAHAAHVLRGAVYELDEFLRAGLSEEQCARSKNKARSLYLGIADSAEKVLAWKLDDAYYGMAPGYLDSYLKSVDAVTCPEINAALRAHIRTEGMRFVVVTSSQAAAGIAAQIADESPVFGKGAQDYQMEDKEPILKRDALWANTRLGISKDRIRIVPAGKMFETGELPK